MLSSRVCGTHSSQPKFSTGCVRLRRARLNQGRIVYPSVKKVAATKTPALIQRFHSPRGESSRRPGWRRSGHLPFRPPAAVGGEHEWLELQNSNREPAGLDGERWRAIDSPAFRIVTRERERAAIRTSATCGRNERFNRARLSLGMAVDGASWLACRRGAALRRRRGRGRDDLEATATIRSGLDAGRQQPRWRPTPH